MLSAAFIRQLGRFRRPDTDRGSQQVPRGLPVALLLGSLAVVAVTVTACAVVLDSSSGVRAGWAEVVTAPTTTPAQLVTQAPAAQRGLAQLAYPPSALQGDRSGPPLPAPSASPPPSAVQRSWSTIKLMFR
ncbi:hypothetical protein [uncultured Hymenobacter sp.]|uniref:hypothetical protein n=1 Tax=uncultured Hymenobacter sp. TaxID=170016 RepID=UPI0035CA5819